MIFGSKPQSSMPSLNTAIVGLENGTLGLRHDVSLPSLEDDMLLVRNRAIALNPIDTKMVGSLGTPGAVAGMDFAGEVVAIGPKVKTSVPIRVGDRVCGAVPGMHAPTPHVGAFATVVGAPDVTTVKIPEHMSFEEAASLGSGLGTIGLALFRSLKVPGSPMAPAEKPVDVLVYGGSTATGTLAIQLLKLSGLNPIATCSPHNFDLVRSYGASKVFDYRSETCTSDIKAHTRNQLKFALDCIAEPETLQFCYACLGRTGGHYTALEPYPEALARASRPKTVKPDWVLGPVVLGKPLGWPAPFDVDGDAAAREFAIGWFATAQKLLDEGRLRTHPLRVMEGGLGDVTDGLELLRKKQVSGQKLIYRVEGPREQPQVRENSSMTESRKSGGTLRSVMSTSGRAIRVAALAAYLAVFVSVSMSLRALIMPLVLASQLSRGHLDGGESIMAGNQKKIAGWVRSDDKTENLPIDLMD